MLNLGVRVAHNFNDEPTYRVVIAAASRGRKPAVAPFDLSADTRSLCFALERLFFVFIFQTEQFTLPVQTDVCGVLSMAFHRLWQARRVEPIVRVRTPFDAESH